MESEVVLCTRVAYAVSRGAFRVAKHSVARAVALRRYSMCNIMVKEGDRWRIAKSVESLGQKNP